MKKIFLDTSFLIDAVRFKVDLKEIESLVGPCEIVVLGSVLGELRKISETQRLASKHAVVALKLAEKFSVQRSEKTNADSDLISKADENSLVATDDNELKKILKSSGVKTIYLRAKKHLAIG